MRARIDGTTIENHPNVLQAAARVKGRLPGRAAHDDSAPVTGYVAKRSVQVGQRVDPARR